MREEAPSEAPAPARPGAGLVLALAFTAMFVSGPGQSFLISVFVDDLLASTGISRTAFSSIYAGATVCAGLLTLLIGRVADRLGLRALWLGAVVGLATACLLTSLAEGIVLAAVSLALLRAFGHGSLPLVGTLLANHSVHQRRGAAVAAANFGLSAATIALPPLVALLIDGVGWRASFRILGLVVLALAPLAFAIRPAAPGPAAAAVGVEPAVAVAPGAAALARARPWPRRRGGHVAGVDRSAVLLLAVLVPLPIVATGLTFHAVSLLAGRGLDRPAAALALSAIGIAAAISTGLAAGVIDRLSTSAMLVAMSATLLVSTLVLLVPVGLLAYPGFALMGLATALFSLASGIAWARTYGLAGLGRRQGVSFAVISVSAAVGPLPLAVSRSLTGSYTAGLVLLAALSAVGVVAALRWREPDNGPVPTSARS